MEDGKHHLGAVIDSIKYRDNYVTQKVSTWLDELNMLCDITKLSLKKIKAVFLVGINISLHTSWEPFQIYLMNKRKLTNRS